MSRRREVAKREILPDPKFGSELIAKFINAIMHSGKKSTAEKIVYGALDIMHERLKGGQGHKHEAAADVNDIKNAQSSKAYLVDLLDKALDSIRPSVEVRARRVGGSTYQIPVEVRPSRRNALAMRWVKDAAGKRGEKTMIMRLAAELLDALDGKGAAVKKREDTHRMAKANQAFAHFRWN